jgi:ketosteroid isomerase-like protein
MIARMATRTGNWCTVLAASGLVLACGSRRPDAQSSAPGDRSARTASLLAAARPEIEAANAAWVRGMQQHQSAPIADAYLEDGVFVTDDGQTIRGRAAIAQMYEQRLARTGAVLGGGVAQDGIEAVGDRIYEWGHAWLELAAPRAGDPPVKRGGQYLTVWQRDAAAGGHWRILRNLVLPPPVR